MSVSTKRPNPPVADLFEEQGWPPYDPSAYERFEDPPIPPHEYNRDRPQPYPGQASRTLPGAPPEIFEEWDGIPGPGEESRRWAQTQGPSGSNGNVRQPIYGGVDIPRFGPQYGISLPSRINAQNFPMQSPIVMRYEAANSYEDMLRNADADLERAYLESLESLKGPETRVSPINAGPPPPTSPKAVPEETAASTGLFSRSRIGPTSCIICTEDFSATVRPPPWISLACLHEPSVCCDCLAKCIKSDLENKIWNQIKCPECNTLLIYEDIERLADRKTFSRYEVMSFRSAVGGDNNFVWCTGCDFGQLHEGGAAQPIIRCLNCGFRSCFVHSIPWHERLTCEEYDEMLQDPDGFKSAIDRDEEAYDAARRLQDEEDERLARELSERDRRAEEDRQREQHAEQRRRAKAEQEAEAARQRERHAEEERRAKAEQKAEAARKKVEEEQARRIEALKKRQKEEQLSNATVQSTTKPCPGCRWPIEKNAGCDHMTCIKCRFEFCWLCLSDYKTIRGQGNSRHQRSCRFHTDNLPS